jgi:hypothetical protein
MLLNPNLQIITIQCVCILLPYPNLHIIPQTKNPTNVGLDVVKRLVLFQQDHFLYLHKNETLNQLSDYRKFSNGIPIRHIKMSNI